MLKFKEIKTDHRNGYHYMEYLNKWAGYDVTYIKEGDTLVIFLENDNSTCTARFDMIDFLKMSYKQFTHKVCEWLFYNSKAKNESN